MEGRFIPRSLTPATSKLSAATKRLRFDFDKMTKPQSARVPTADHESAHAPAIADPQSAHVPILAQQSAPVSGVKRSMSARVPQISNVEEPLRVCNHQSPRPLTASETQVSNRLSSLLQPTRTTPPRSPNIPTSPNPKSARISTSPDFQSASAPTTDELPSAHVLQKTKVQGSNVQSARTPAVSVRPELKTLSARVPATRLSSQSTHALSNKFNNDLNSPSMPEINTRSEIPASKTVKTDGSKSVKQVTIKPPVAPRTQHVNSNNSSSNGLNISSPSDPSTKENQFRPLTMLGNPHSSTMLSVNRPKTAAGGGGLGYSSHDVTTRHAAPNPVLSLIATQHSVITGTGSGSRPGLERRGSLASVTSIGSNIARDKAAERRQDLLEEEQYTMAEIENKRQDFLD